MHQTVAKILIDQGFTISLCMVSLAYMKYHDIFSINNCYHFCNHVNAYNFIDGVDGLAISGKENPCFSIHFHCDDPFYNLGILLCLFASPSIFSILKKEERFFLVMQGLYF